MDDHARDDDRPAGLTRRRLLAVGGAGVATVLLAPGIGIAEAAPLRAELRRSTWTALHDGDLVATVDGRPVALRLAEVADLPVAETVPALRGHDGAFALRFTGPDGLRAGTHALRHAELGDVELFLSPVGAAGSGRRYEAIVDRTVRIAGVNEEGAPVGVGVPPVRAGQPVAAAAPAAMVTAAGTPVPAAPARRRPRLRTVAVRRTAERGGAVLDVVLAGAAAGTRVNAVLLRRGRVVARAGAPVRRGGAARIRLHGRRPLTRGRYEVAVVVVGPDGRITRFRRRERLA